MRLDGVSAIVTGGASGLGRATAYALAKRGVRVVIVDIGAERGRAVAGELDATYVDGDVTEPAAVVRAVEAAEALGPLRALVNAAGVGSATRTIGRDGTFESAHDLDHFRRVVDVNLVGTFNCVRLAGTAMSRTEPDRHGERGAIVNVASVAAFEGQIGQAAYAASKSGVVGLTLPLARDLSVTGVRVNCIAPGLIDTPMYGTGEQAERFKDRLKGGVLFPHRFGEPAEFASLAVELLENSYVNAATVRIDGGIRMPPK
jgi:NAD(P)-dependent dehydrogenase (short-subunit alcohol dehydrogenase family)